MLTYHSIFTAEKKPFTVYQRQRLLVIENNLTQQKLVCRVLAEQAFEIQFASNGLEGLALFTEQEPDLVLLNLALPGLDGFELCRRIRECSNIPILMLVAVENAIDNVTALDLGADDCLTTPFSPEELRARVQALLRRSYWREKPALPGAVRVGGLEINFQSLQLIREGEAVYLSQTEWTLLEILVRHTGKVVSHDVLHRAVWGDTNYKESSNLRRYIHRLRSKLEIDPDNPRYLVSEPGIGYCFLGQRETANAPVESRKSSRPLTQLPIPPTSFIGWSGEVERVKSLLQTPDVRLVSLVGPGGAGKTRLGLQVASQLIENFEYGVHFVALASIQESNLVGAAIAQALGVKEEKGFSPEESLKAYFSLKKMLLVLDNFEQVLGAATLISDLLETGSGLKILVTSRSVLHLYGEHEFEVPPLALPDLRRPSIPEVSQSPAVALFIERARAIQPGFNLTPQNVVAVAELCVQLDGLPLAIELAAARMKLLSPQAIASRLSNRFTLLADGAQNLPKRQQTMRSTLDWSYDLLTLEEKVLFARLGAFEGGCTLDAVEAVAGMPFESGKAGVVNIDALEHLPSLLDKSMLMREMAGEEVRFKMLETIREYAHERLEASGEAELLRQRHTRYYLRLAEAAHPELESALAEIWGERLEQEHDNLRAALQWALGRENQKETALQLATTLGVFWKSRGYWGEGRRWLEAALSYGNNTRPAARAQAFREAAWLALMQGDCTQAEKFLGMGQELWEALKDDPDVTCIMGLILDGQGKYEQARALVQAGLESYRQLGDKKNVAFALQLLGQTTMKQADYDLAQTYMHECIAVRRELGAKPNIARSILTLAHTTRLKGDYDLACEQYRESLAIFEEADLSWGVAHCLMNLGKIACARGEFAQAGQLYLQTLNIFDELGDRYSLAYSLEALASLAGLQRQSGRAARLWGAAQTLRKVLCTPLPPADSGPFEAEVKNIKDFLAESGQSDAAFLTAWEAGRAMALEDVIAFARKI